MKPIDFRCPACKAQPGQKCHHHGKVMKVFHQWRIELFQNQSKGHLMSVKCPGTLLKSSRLSAQRNEKISNTKNSEKPLPKLRVASISRHIPLKNRILQNHIQAARKFADYIADQARIDGVICDNHPAMIPLLKAEKEFRQSLEELEALVN